MVESVAARWRACGMMLTMSGPGLAVVGLLIAAGIVGVVVPVLPGAALAWAAIGVWAVAVGSPAGGGGAGGAAPPGGGGGGAWGAGGGGGARAAPPPPPRGGGPHVGNPPRSGATTARRGRPPPV